MGKEIWFGAFSLHVAVGNFAYSLVTYLFQTESGIYCLQKIIYLKINNSLFDCWTCRFFRSISSQNINPTYHVMWMLTCKYIAINSPTFNHCFIIKMSLNSIKRFIPLKIINIILFLLSINYSFYILFLYYMNYCHCLLHL